MIWELFENDGQPQQNMLAQLTEEPIPTLTTFEQSAQDLVRLTELTGEPFTVIAQTCEDQPRLLGALSGIFHYGNATVSFELRAQCTREGELGRGIGSAMHSEWVENLLRRADHLRALYIVATIPPGECHQTPRVARKLMQRHWRAIAADSPAGHVLSEEELKHREEQGESELPDVKFSFGPFAQPACPNTGQVVDWQLLHPALTNAQHSHALEHPHFVTPVDLPAPNTYELGQKWMGRWTGWLPRAPAEPAPPSTTSSPPPLGNDFTIRVVEYRQEGTSTSKSTVVDQLDFRVSANDSTEALYQQVAYWLPRRPMDPSDIRLTLANHIQD